jgi:MoaA/NifB/PqqE/SkfB family radical SAM enzyme
MPQDSALDTRVRVAEPIVRTESVGKVRLSSVGLHWFSRTTGLNVLADEVRVPQSRWDRAPRHVSIALTNACDLRCRYCYAPKDPARLPRDRVLAWVRELDANGCLGIGFGGGEPTIYPQFASLCSEAAATSRLAITFTTHGHHITDRLVRHLRGSVHFIRVSVDGVGPVYESLRGRSFAELRRRLALVSEICSFGLNVVVNSASIASLDGLVDLARDVGAREVLLLPERPTRTGAGIDALTRRRLEDWIRTAERLVPLSISQADASDALGLAVTYPNEDPLDGHAHVDASGVLKRDSYQRNGVVIGESVLDALDALRAQEVPS